jgi:uncharacterized protein YbcI
MNNAETIMAQEVAQVAIAFQTQQTGHAPGSVTVVISQDTLVITLHDALTPAEKAMAVNSEGAAKVQEFHRQLFHASADSLRKEITRITGRDVKEATAEVQPGNGTVVHAFTSGNLVQLFTLGNPASMESGREPVGLAGKPSTS